MPRLGACTAWNVHGCDHRPVQPDADRAPDGVIRVRAANPSALTLEGTNTYVVERWVVDPGPPDADHVAAVLEAAAEGVEGIVLTHGHEDHAGAAALLSERAGRPPILRPDATAEVGPFRAIPTPGHSPDHVCLLRERVCFTGDAVLGAGSVFVAPGGGALAAYLESLERLREADLEVLCPGHGPFVWDPAAKLDEYIEHRLERERRLVEALERGARSRDELLDRAWSDAPAELRGVAAVSLAAHLEKLRDERRLPPEVEGIDELPGA